MSGAYRDDMPVILASMSISIRYLRCCIPSYLQSVMDDSITYADHPLIQPNLYVVIMLNIKLSYLFTY